jgi:hypothetical protein
MIDFLQKVKKIHGPIFHKTLTEYFIYPSICNPFEFQITFYCQFWIIKFKFSFKKYHNFLANLKKIIPAFLL